MQVRRGARRREPVADERQQHDRASDVVAFLRCWRRAAREHPRRCGARRRSRRIIHGAPHAFLMARGARTEPSGTRLKEQLAARHVRRENSAVHGRQAGLPLQAVSLSRFFRALQTIIKVPPKGGGPGLALCQEGQLISPVKKATRQTWRLRHTRGPHGPPPTPTRKAR